MVGVDNWATSVRESATTDFVQPVLDPGDAVLRNSPLAEFGDGPVQWHAMISGRATAIADNMLTKKRRLTVVSKNGPEGPLSSI